MGEAHFTAIVRLIKSSNNKDQGGKCLFTRSKYKIVYYFLYSSFVDASRKKKAVKRLDRDGKRERETRKIESERCSKGVLKDMYTYQKK